MVGIAYVPLLFLSAAWVGQRQVSNPPKTVTVDVKSGEKLGIAFRNADLLVTKVGPGPAKHAGIEAYVYTVTAVRGVPVDSAVRFKEVLADAGSAFSITFQEEPVAEVIKRSNDQKQNSSVPRVLSVETPPMHADKAGEYVLVEGVEGNGAPTWCTKNKMYWMYFATNQRWTIEGSAGVKEGKDFNTNRGWMTAAVSAQSAPHQLSLPHQVDAWLHWNGKTWAQSGDAMTVRVPPPTVSSSNGTVSNITQLVESVKQRRLLQAPDIKDLDRYLLILEAQKNNANATESHADLAYIKKRLKEGLLPRATLLELAKQQRQAQADTKPDDLVTLYGARHSAVM